MTLCPSNPLISLLQGDEEAGGSRITLAQMLVGCGMFVWEWSWEWSLQPSKKKTITLLFSKYSKNRTRHFFFDDFHLQLGLSVYLIYSYPKIQWFIMIYLITSPMNIAIEVPTQPVAQRDLATGCRYAGTHGGWCPGRTTHRPAMPGGGQGEEAFQSVLSKNWVPKSSGW